MGQTPLHPALIKVQLQKMGKLEQYANMPTSSQYKAVTKVVKEEYLSYIMMIGVNNKWFG